MQTYRIQVTADRYPTEYAVEASNWATAVARGIRLWQKKFKGTHAIELKISVVRINHRLA